MKSLLVISVCSMIFIVSEFRICSCEKVSAGKFIQELRQHLSRARNAKHMADRNYTALDTFGLVRRHGYPVEEHRVVTEDGYGLRIFRIPASPWSPKSDLKSVVFLQHGVLWSSDAFVLMGPNHDLSFMLADSGYDVWMGNVRGNTYGKTHRTRHHTNPEFWDFSYHEMGTQDLPAMFDYVLGLTNQKSLYFVGHSMGATIAYVMLSLRPEYNEKIKLLISLAPVTFWRHKLNPIQTFFKQAVFPLQESFKRNSVYEILPQTTTLAKRANEWCREDAVSHITCLKIIFGVVGEDHQQLNATLLPYLFTYFPAGTSLRTMVHFHQNLQSGEFQTYDFKRNGNLARYGRTRPPFYPIDKITAPVALIHGSNDAIVTAKEIYELTKYLRNVTILEAVPYGKFNHMDFIWARDAKDLLYDRILQLIKQY